ncbi:serine/threonine-protein kinase EDR1 isoform X1 [Sesamum indicum]|uniref:non-specific serine/threonine protein kinase n=1 Tax=Sesamum indicum TaxID=4182 RepID=A0A6I9T9M4_SESIN|nr:serine/threonine-protein kinase EDR1 isoform X1 [Sesamum indicum]
MDGGDKSAAGLYRLLLDRFQSLEASHQKLQEQFQVLLQEKTSNVSTKTFQEKDVTSDSGDMSSFPGWDSVPGTFYGGHPYRKVLEHMGHAVHVCRAGSGEIIYWNCAAEKLFGYKEYDVIGQRVVELLFDEEHYRLARALLERLSAGESWSGQLPLRKRSGQNFMAMVTKSPLYEDSELVGIVTVSSDAAVFNYSNWGNMRAHEDHANGHSFRRINLKKIQWHPQPQIAAVPQLASSVSNLASKFLRKRGDISCNTCRSTTEGEQAEVESQDARADRPPRAPTAKPGFSLSIGKSKAESMSSESQESTFELAQAPKFAIKLFSKLQIGAISNVEKAVDENIQQNGSEDNSRRKEAANGACCRRDSIESTSPICNLDANNYHAEDDLAGTPHALERKQRDTHLNPSVTNDQLLRSSDEKESVANVPNIKPLDSEDASPRQSDCHKIPTSGESFGSGHGSSSSRGENDSHMVVDIEIRWEDLQLREQVGQGSFAVVYRGVWNGSDVAVKVYSGSQYSEQTLLDYKKEIDIMRRLRHPNVLLFMGAVCTEEKLAMVTEYLTRGSLFKTLHRNNQSLDVKRRLKMALDVARGMNYLHHRNPPIVHRDLKSSNLLVDKSWTVKVGDFGLSKLKDSTFLTARSGRGTPQWMAPEVLRNEPSTEKSDVFSYGVILWELMTVRIPWSNLNSLQVVGIVGFMDRRLDIPDNMDHQISSIISDCWQSNPEDRPSFEDIIRRMTDLVHTSSGATARTASTP